MNTIEKLEDWNYQHKSHAVEIDHDNGYGASCWCISLYAGEVIYTVSEVDLLEENNDDWPGLEKTILAALKKVGYFNQKK